MASLVFPDNTVLCNFAAVGRTELLAGWLRGRGRWCEAVHAEAGQSVRYWPDLQSFLGPDSPLGAPIEISEPGLVARIERVRVSVFGGSPHEPTKHLGEAQTCVLLAEDAAFSGSWWITDDADAYEYAMRRQIQALRTWDVLVRVVADGDLTARAAYALMEEMRRRGRHLDMPGSPSDLLA